MKSGEFSCADGLEPGCVAFSIFVLFCMPLCGPWPVESGS